MALKVVLNAKVVERRDRVVGYALGRLNGKALRRFDKVVPIWLTTKNLFNFQRMRYQNPLI